MYDEFAIAHHLRERGWVVPAYTMAPHAEKMKLMRVVVREDFTRSRCDALILDFKHALDTLNAMDKTALEQHKEWVLPSSRDSLTVAGTSVGSPMCRGPGVAHSSTRTMRTRTTASRASMARRMESARLGIWRHWMEPVGLGTRKYLSIAMPFNLTLSGIMLLPCR